MRVKNFATLMAAGVSMFASAAVLAEREVIVEDFGFDYDGIYILGGVGVAGVEHTSFSGGDSFDHEEFVPPFSSKADFAWRAGIGAWFADNFAVEVNYIGMKEDSDTKDGFKIKTRDMYYLDISGLGRHFFTERLWGFARLGAAWAGVDRKVYFDDVAIAKSDEGGVGASIGMGAQYDFTDMIGLRLEASTVQALNDNDMYAFTGNIVINFGELM